MTRAADVSENTHWDTYKHEQLKDCGPLMGFTRFNELCILLYLFTGHASEIRFHCDAAQSSVCLCYIKTTVAVMERQTSQSCVQVCLLGAERHGGKRWERDVECLSCSHWPTGLTELEDASFVLISWTQITGRATSATTASPSPGVLFVSPHSAATPQNKHISTSAAILTFYSNLWVNMNKHPLTHRHLKGGHKSRVNQPLSVY